MKKVYVIRFVIYFIFLAGPILAALNCPGWNEGVGSTGECVIDTEFLRKLASASYTMLLISAFTLFLPILIYIGIIIYVTEWYIKGI